MEPCAVRGGSGADTREIARMAKLSAATVSRYCGVGSAITPDALREAGVAFDEAVKMPLRALSIITQTEDRDARRQKLAVAQDARRRRRSVLHAVAPHLDTSSRPYTLRRTRSGGLSLAVRSPAEQWPSEVVETFVREFREEAMPVVGSAWTRVGTAPPAEVSSNDPLPPQSDGAEQMREQARKAGAHAGFQIGRQYAEKQAAEQQAALRSQIAELTRRLEQAQRATPGEVVRQEMHVRVADLEGNHAKEVSHLKLRYELAMAQLRQQADQAREKHMSLYMELQRDTAALSQERTSDQQEIERLRAELAEARGGGLKGWFAKG